MNTMKNIHFKRLLFIVVLVSVIASVTVSGAFAQTNQKTDADSVDSSNHTSTDASNLATASEKATVGVYVDYEDVNLSELEGDIVLDFWASWCPSCRNLEANIKENLENIPAAMTIVKINYSKERDLVKKYKVTSQHTFVHIDNEGEVIRKWLGGSTLQDIIDQVEKNR